MEPTGVQVVFFREADGSVPVLSSIEKLPVKVQDKVVVRIERLQKVGLGLRRPEADLLRDGIYELRVARRRVQYRILYFFHEKTAILASLIQKESKVPAIEIERALRRKNDFKSNPAKHSCKGGDEAG